jgi:putative transposase
VVEAFRWSLFRTVTKTATVSLAGNRYQVDPSLVGRKVELRFDPEDLDSLSVYAEGRLTGIATPYVIGRHVHPAVPQASRPPVDAPKVVDYLNQVLSTYDDEIAGSISYRDLDQEASQ